MTRSELRFGFLQLLLERRIGVQSGDNRRADNARGVNVALPVVTTNHPALAQVEAALEDLILSLRVHFRQHQRRSPANRRMA